jgi:uncharacterized membrane-anchored protein
MMLSSEIEDVAAATTYRFSAARAYYALVLRRVEELREQRRILLTPMGYTRCTEGYFLFPRVQNFAILS